MLTPTNPEVSRSSSITSLTTEPTATEPDNQAPALVVKSAGYFLPLQVVPADVINGDIEFNTKTSEEPILRLKRWLPVPKQRPEVRK